MMTTTQQGKQAEIRDIHVTIPADLLAQTDRARGATSRSEWVRRALGKQIPAGCMGVPDDAPIMQHAGETIGDKAYTAAMQTLIGALRPGGSDDDLRTAISDAIEWLRYL